MDIDLKEFNIFFKTYQPRFVRFAVNYLQSLEEAEDVVMESMLALWERREQLDEDTNLPAYVLTSVKNKCLNHLKSIRVKKKDSLDELEQWEVDMRINALKDFDPHLVYSEEIRNIVSEALSSLSPQTRRIFNMSRYENKTYQEIALLNDVSVKSIEYHITKALKVLRTALTDYLPLGVIVIMLR